MAFFGFIKSLSKDVEAIKKVPRDYALDMHRVIAGLPANERDAALYALIRIVHPDKHLHRDPKKKGNSSTGR